MVGLIAGLALALAGSRQIPASPGLTRTQANNSFLRGPNAGYVVISNRPGESQYLQSVGAGSTYCFSCRSLFYLPSPIADTTDLKVDFFNACNYNNNDYMPGPNTLKIKATLWVATTPGSLNQTYGDYPIGQFTFGGSSTGICGRGQHLWGELHGVTLTAGTPYFIHSVESCAVPAAPPSPSVTNSGSGSNFSAGGPWYVSVTYHWPTGEESAASPYSSGVTVTSGQNIVVSSPTNPVNGSDGYRVFISTSGLSSTNYPAYDCNIGVVPYGINATITYPPNTNAVGWIEGVFASGASSSIIGGGAIYGGTSAGGRNSGEWVATNSDISGGSRVPGTANGGNAFMPNAILAATTTSGILSGAVIGDSIADGTGDAGFGGSQGIGYLARAISNQASSIQFNPATVPAQGYVCVAVGSDSAKNFASNQGLSRVSIANLASQIFCDYGTNDLTYGSAAIVNSIVAIARRHTSLGKPFRYTGLLPRGGVGSANSAYTNLTDQILIVGAQSEAARRAVNNAAADITGAITISNENLFQGFAGGVGPSYNVYGGGNGTATQFWFSRPCSEGTESITNGASTCTFNASPSTQLQYSYLLPTIINGTTYASGIQFGAPPTTGNPIVATYTKCPSLSALIGSLFTFLNAPQYIEVNGYGVAGTNGGFIALSSAPVVGTISSPQTVTSTSSTGFTDSTLSPTQDQYAGYCVAIVSDSVVPAAAGQVQCIATNSTGGVFTCGTWNVQPSNSAKYVILKSYMQTSTHPSSFGHMTIAAGLRAAFPGFFP